MQLDRGPGLAPRPRPPNGGRIGGNSIIRPNGLGAEKKFHVGGFEGRPRNVNFGPQ